MVILHRRKIEVGSDEIVMGDFAYKRAIDALPLPSNANPAEYVQLFRGNEANSALSLRQHLNGLAFDPMIQESYKIGLPLAEIGEFTRFHRDINLALNGEGILYDASGNLIEGKRLAGAGNMVNNAWIYLNSRFENSLGDKGFLGLDLVRVVGFDGENPILERQPLEECVVGGWADVRGELNGQGLYTKKAKTQGFEQGKTIYVHKPKVGSVAGFIANPDRALLIAYWDPTDTISSVGCILRADEVGGAPKITQ